MLQFIKYRIKQLLLATLKMPGNTQIPVLLLLLACHFFFPVQALEKNNVEATPGSSSETELSNDDLTPPEKKIFTIGILNQNSSTSIVNSPWELTFDRLNVHSEYQFVPLFLSLDRLIEHLENDELDFIICDAINYLKFEKKYRILRLLTRDEYHKENFTASEGISVYTLNDNAEVISLDDLKNKTIGILDNKLSVSWSFLDEFLAQHNLIKNINIKLFSDIHNLFNTLQTKKIDAIISKSGTLDKYLSEENLDSVRLINPRRAWQAPFLHSSILIPEWPIAKAWFIDDQLANQVISLLLSKSNDDIDEAEEISNYFSTQYHWTIAQNYNIQDKLFSFSNETNQRDNSEEISFSAKIQYWISFIIICILVIVLFFYLRSSKDLNTRLTLSKGSLEQEIKERQYAQEQALNHQAELAHVARLNTMGEIASGLAHELNQPLSAINTYVQGCIRRIKMGTDDKESIINALQLTAQQAERAGGIIRRLRSFVRKGETHKTYIEINYLVNEVTGFLESQLKNKSIILILELKENLPPVLADIIQIEQVLINLIKNAIEALSNIENASITLSTKISSNPNLIEVCVIDTGHGISEDKLKRIFNPFFTTKSSGMGMGLSISNSIIEMHGGKLYAHNIPQQGARFCFTLPIVEEPSGNNNE